MRDVFSTSVLLYGSAILLVVVLVGSIHIFTAQAGFYTLYSTTCLGGWKNTDLAAGSPEAMGTEGAPVFTEKNSAQLSGDTHAQLYCGGFKGDILEETIPKKVLVKFSWAIEYPKLDNENIQTEETPATTTDPVKEDDTTGSSKDESVDDSDTEPQPQTSPQTEPQAEPVAEPQPTPVESQNEAGSEASNKQDTDASTPASTPTPTPTPQSTEAPAAEATVSFLKLFTSIVHAEESTSIEADPTSEKDSLATTTASTTPTIAPYGLVEVLYTFDGVDWKSLGFVKKDEFNSKHFEVPIEEASQWEDISKIQIGIQSVPVLDERAPIIYLDSVWIEAEYEYADPEDESRLTSVKDALMDIFDETEDTEEESEDQEITEEMPQEILPAAPPLSIREFSKNINFDTNATHRCEASPFSIDVSGRSSFSTKIALEKSPKGEYYIEIGSLPEGIDMRFADNSEYLYNVPSDQDMLTVRIENQERSRTGNFTVPLIFTKKDKIESSVVCQINIVNL